MRTRLLTPTGRTALWTVAASLIAGLATAKDPAPDFDHTATRFVLTGSHENVPCQGCHAEGVFTGTPTDCSWCHDGSGMRAESGKPLDHVPTTNRCEDCHTSVTWAEVRFDHVAALGSCSGCHNGFRAEGKPMGHLVTNAECDLCHNTVIWEAAGFDHSGVTQPCSTCHNGMDATGKPNGHLPTTAECDLCHSTQSWTPASFDHTGITQPCSSCHNGMDATGKPAGHFVTMRECDECHRTNAWLPDTFAHTSPNYPGDHRRNLDCRACHPGYTETVVYTDDPSLAPDCAGCHRNDFRSGPHKKHENPDAFYTVQELRDCTGSCHVYTDATLTQIKETRNGEHRVSDGSFD